MIILHLEYEKSVEVLLKAGISREIIAGVTALHLAASTGKEHQLEMIILSNVIYASCGLGLEKIAKMLIETGSDVNPVALDGSTPLHVAALEGRSDSIIPAICSFFIYLIFLFCFFVGREKVVQLLLENGADTNRLNNLGQTALVVAKQKGKQML